MGLFNKKVKCTILNKTWETLFEEVSFNIVPRENELIFYKNKYYRVLNLVHKLYSNERITIIVEEFGIKV